MSMPQAFYFLLEAVLVTLTKQRRKTRYRLLRSECDVPELRYIGHNAKTSIAYDNNKI